MHVVTMKTDDRNLMECGRVCGKLGKKEREDRNVDYYNLKNKQ